MMDAKLFVGENQNTWDCELMHTKYSLYSGEPSVLIVPNWGSCFQSRSIDYLDMDEETYEPLADQFVLSGIQINGRAYLERSLDGSFQYPASKKVPSQCEILYGPDTLNGHDEESLYLGVITSVHNKLGLTYAWFRNHQAITIGANMSAIKVKAPGSYFCRVSYKDREMMSTMVEVVYRR